MWNAGFVSADIQIKEFLNLSLFGAPSIFKGIIFFARNDQPDFQIQAAFADHILDFFVLAESPGIVVQNIDESFCVIFNIVRRKTGFIKYPSRFGNNGIRNIVLQKSAFF